jgi:signal peptidase I
MDELLTMEKNWKTLSLITGLGFLGGAAVYVAVHFIVSRPVVLPTPNETPNPAAIQLPSQAAITAQTPTSTVASGTVATASETTGVASCTSTESVAFYGLGTNGFVEEGAKLEVQKNYYACHKPEKGDIVVYDFVGIPTLERVAAVPGDTFTTHEASNYWTIYVNGKPAFNSKKEPYHLSPSGKSMIDLYSAGPKGVVPAGTYLLLGDTQSGSKDSTAFGLTTTSSFMGKTKL